MKKSVKKIIKNILLNFTICGFVFANFSSCKKNQIVTSINRDDLFSLKYGSFENQLNLFDLNESGNSISTELTMQNGFFYISNGESKKILQMNSYGDLLTLYYNKDENPFPIFNSSDLAIAGTQKNQEISTKKAIDYPFNKPSLISVDSKQRVYVAESLPLERQENENNRILRQVVLRFNEDSFIDYIGQQGPGGTPFPLIEKIYTTSNNELVVICIVSEGVEVYWFSESGYLLHNILINSSDAPNPFDEKNEGNVFFKVEKVIPDNKDYKLFVKIDYYNATFDQSSRAQAGIEYNTTYIYPLDAKTGKYGKPLVIPAFEEVSTHGFSKQTRKNPYDFLGVTTNNWLFFTITTDSGYIVQMVDSNGNHVLKRLLQFENDKALYHNFALSKEGIVSALLSYKEKTDVVWWRTDSLIDALVKK